VKFGHVLIKAMYDGTAAEFLNRLIEGQAKYPLGLYLEEADRAVRIILMFMVSLIAAINLPLDRLYDGAISMCAFCLRHKKEFLGITVAIVIIMTVFVAVFCLQGFPNSQDEDVFIYQAKTLLSGRSWNVAHPLREFFKRPFIMEQGDRLFSQYLPGWPLILAFAMLIKCSVIYVNPLLGAVTILMLFFVAERIYGGRTAVISVIVTSLSSYFIFTSASFFSHTACALMVLLFVYFFLRYTREAVAHNIIFAGMFFGAAFLMRPFTAFLCALPPVIYLLCRNSKRPSWMFLFAAGGVPYQNNHHAQSQELYAVLSGPNFFRPSLLHQDHPHYNLQMR